VTRDGRLHEAGLLAGLGAGLGLAFSPTLTPALGQVVPEDAADASGFMATVTQLGQLIGVATFGTLFLNRVALADHVHPSAHAIAVTAAALAATAAVGAVAGLRR
jgi:hypothetical protein